MKIEPEPEDAQCGLLVQISQEEAAAENLRILSSCNQEAPKKKAWFLPAEEPLELLFFRSIFTELKKQCGPLPAEGEDNIPIAMFQRAFERLFYVLADEEPFDAQVVDKNRNGYVGWGEFAYVFKKKAISIRLSTPERIYLTFDNPNCSHSAGLLSFFVLAVICCSSLCFILSTAQEFQKEPVGTAKPEPKDAFDVIEHMCLIVFVLEYVVRLCTCWAVREEVFDRKRLLSIAIGSETINASYPAGRLIAFVTGFSNLIDLVAILPGVVGWLSLLFGFGGLEGGGFVVLRLVRLTRIFRAFKNPKLVEPVIVIARTITNSTKALYVLGFNLLLGILIFGSLMYVFEKGEWDPETRKYNRYTGREWNVDTRVWDDIFEESPFLSIPHAFWWAVVTAMTVGYGDMYPTRTTGFVIGTATMVFSLIILALPIGVIGGNFSQAWSNYEAQKAEEAAALRRNKRYITAAIQRVEPFEMSKLMLIEVWNERCPIAKGTGPTGRVVLAKPDVAEFMGQVCLRLEIPPDEESRQTHTLRLRPLTHEKSEKREVSGSITVQYEWMPMETKGIGCSPMPPTLGDEDITASRSESFTANTALQGRLKVTLLGADNLINLSYHKSGKTFSNPYAMVFLYPNSPAVGEILCPSVWRSPCELNNLSPRWGACQSWNFLWHPMVEIEEAVASPNSGVSSQRISQRIGSKRSSACSPREQSPQGSLTGCAIHPEPNASDSDPGSSCLKVPDDEVLKVLQRFGRDVTQLRDEVRNVKSRIFQKI